MKKIISLMIIGVFLLTVCGCSSDNNTLQETTVAETTAIATTVEPTTVESFFIAYTLDIENSLCNITYQTPSEFETKGTSGLIYNHKSPENDNLTVSYTSLGENIALYTESQANELLDATIEGIKGEREDFELYSKKYIEIASCFGIEFSYQMDGIYCNNYAFLWKDGVYQFMYSSIEPLSLEDNKLLAEIIDSILLQL